MHPPPRQVSGGRARRGGGLTALTTLAVARRQGEHLCAWHFNAWRFQYSNPQEVTQNVG